MNLFVELASAKMAASESRSRRLEDGGWLVVRHNGRYCVQRPLSKLEDLGSFFHKPVFRLMEEDNFEYPEIFSVVFKDVTCRSVNNFSNGFLNLVIMVDPNNPIHTRLFHFVLALDLQANSIKISVDRAQLITQTDLCLFESILKICAREFYSKDKCVFFRTRKQIGRAKRRYLAWLETQLEKFKDSKSAWEAIVTREQFYAKEM